MIAKNTELKKHQKNLLFKDFFSIYSFRGEKEYFIDNLKMLLSSGADIISALEVVRQASRNSRMTRLIESIKEDINAGMKISQALEKARLLTNRELTLVRLGEGTGKIAESLDVIVRQGEKQKQFKGKVLSATMYPIVVLSVTVLVAIGISWYILPKLATVFSQLNLKLPLVTRVVLGIGKFLQQYGTIFVPLFLGAIFLFFYVLFMWGPTKFLGQNLMLRIPGIRQLLQDTEVARFGYLLGTLLEADVPIVGAIESLQEATNFLAYRKLYKYLAESTRDGKPLEEGFRQYPRNWRLFPLPAQFMIAAATQSGKLPETLLKIGERFEAKSDVIVKDLSTMMEPILIIIIWVGVVTVALAVILPIYSLIGGLTH